MNQRDQIEKDLAGLGDAADPRHSEPFVPLHLSRAEHRSIVALV